MSDIFQNTDSSQDRERNFIIPYELDSSLTSEDTNSFLQFIHSNISLDGGINDIDIAFLPRAVTDTDLTDLPNIYPVEDEHNSDSNVQVTGSRGVKVDSVDTTMEGTSGSGPAGFQPDLVMISSNQRPGPDGSPALTSTAAQGFTMSANVSETGELFQPVRHLNFSEIDQSSQIEGSSRLVSTPGRDVTVGDAVQEAYTDRFNENAQMAASQDSSDNSDREMSPEFRQLDGEADSQTNELLTTGAFHPSAFGLNKEFMDQFTGRSSGRMHIGSDVFSPLGSSGGHYPDNRQTPPLHSPGASAPFQRQVRRISPVQQNDQELQFSMSPTRNPPDFISNQNVARSNIGLDLMEGGSGVPVTRHDFLMSDVNYAQHFANQYSFQPVNTNHGENDFGSEYEPDIQHHQQELPVRQRNHAGFNDYNFPTGQGQGSDEGHLARPSSDGQEGDIYDNLSQQGQRQANQQVGEFAQSYSRVSPEVFEQRYLQRRQVSVKLPQATYDTMGDGDQDSATRFDPAGLAPDSLENTACGDGSPHSRQSSPEKIVGLIQTQVTNLKQKGINNTTSRSVDSGIGNQTRNQSADSGNETAADLSKTTVASLKSSDKNNLKEKSKDLHHADVSTNANTADLTTGSRIPVRYSYDSRNAEIVQTLPSDANFSHNNRSENANTRSVNASQTSNSRPVVSYSDNPAMSLPSSRLLQETTSHKNKASQKFVSNAPVKPIPVNQNKDFKKPYEVQKAGSTNTVCHGARKTLEGDRVVKSKLTSERNKSKSASTESLNQKPKVQVSQLRQGNGAEQAKTNQSQRNQGSGNHGDGGEHNVSGGSVEDTGREVPVITQDGGDSSIDAERMEEVRYQLQNMLRMSHVNMSTQDRSHYEHSDILAGHGLEFPVTNPQVDSLSWNMLRRLPEDDVGDVGGFPSFASHYMGDNSTVSRSESSLQTENQRLRDMLEKERYRRKDKLWDGGCLQNSRQKSSLVEEDRGTGQQQQTIRFLLHCEQYIQQLNVKLLEIQQQLAVAVSTDKRKDIMIEQLDKQLARVMEGWKKRDVEKDVYVEQTLTEKAELEGRLKEQQQLIGRFESDMSEAVEALRSEKDNSVKDLDSLKEEMRELERAKGHTEELLGAEREKVELMQQECDNLRDTRETLDKKLDQMQRRLHREQDDWFQREQELLARIDDVSEKNSKILQIERQKNEEQGKLAEEVMEQYQASNTQVKKLDLELDAALREKESVKVEMGIMEAKFENAQRIMEADLHSHMEKQIAEQVADVQKRVDRAEDELRAQHRDQIVELTQRHGREVERQLAQFREEIHVKEDEFRRQLQELETTLLEYRNENSTLKLAKQKLESQRLEILTKLQYMMQSQWNEALSLLSATPQRKKPNANETSDVSGVGTINNSAQSVPTVNFNLHSPYRPPGQGMTTFYSPGQDSTVSHPTVKDDNDGGKPGVPSVDNVVPDADPIETAATAHMRDLQEYINSITQTPEWISSMDTQGESSVIPTRPAPLLPPPPDLAALLSTHIQSIQHHHLHGTQQLVNGVDKPNTQSKNKLTNLSPPRNPTANQKPQSQKSKNLTPPKSKPATHSAVSPVRVSQSETMSYQDDTMSQGFSPGYNDPTGSDLWNGVTGLTHAVPIRPPQQGDDPYGDDQSIISSIAPGQATGYFQGGQSFSPPTKQNRAGQGGVSHNSPQELHIHEASARLNEDYSGLSERMEEHESHQDDLQHYIHMLLHKSPGSVTKEGDESVCSLDDLDLNDTAQASQLQQELDRIQELRRKQERGEKKRDILYTPPPTKPERESTQNHSQSQANGQQKILNAEQLADIGKMLSQVKGQPDLGNPQMLELLDVLKLMQGTKGAGHTPHGHRHSPRVGSDKHRGTKRPIQFQPSRGVDTCKQSADSSKAGKPAAAKKMERKIAGSATKGDKGSKHTAWK